MRLNTSQSTDSLGSRRPARAALPPFTLPPPPDAPRAGAATGTGTGAGTAADGLSPPTGGVRSAGDSSSHSASTSALSSPGFSAPAMSSYGSPHQGNTPLYSTQYGSSLRFHGSPGRLQQPIAPKPPSQSPHKPQQPQQQQQQQLSPARPPPSSPSAPSGFGEKLPPIASLIPGPGSPPMSSHYGAMTPSHHHAHAHSAARTRDSPGHLAPPVGIPLSSGNPNPPFYMVPHPSYSYSPEKPPTGNYLKYNVGKDPYSVRREASQQERPFKCDNCAQSFSRNHDLKRHKRIHLAAKPFPCPHCQKCFSRKDALKRHTLVKACGSRKNVVKSENDRENSEPEPTSPSPAPSSSASNSTHDKRVETIAGPQSDTTAKEDTAKRNSTKKGTPRKGTSKKHSTDDNPAKQDMTEEGATKEDVTMADGDDVGGTKEPPEKESVVSSSGEKEATSKG